MKQTEVDCEYLKRCCETLTEENRRLQKELQELRALKTTNSFYMQLPATTLTMCPSCERVTSTSAASTVAAVATSGGKSTEEFQNDLGSPLLADPVLPLSHFLLKRSPTSQQLHDNEMGLGES